MPFHFKALILVMVITLIMFALAKPLFTQFMAEEDFNRRRNTWLVLTLAAFLIPNFWAFTVLAAIVIAYATSKDSNPAALYLFLLLTLPPIREDIPTLDVVRQIFGLDHLRLLSLALLLPTALKLMSSTGPSASAASSSGMRRGLEAADILFLLYAVIQLALMFPYDSVTSSIRRALLLGVDMLLPYFVLSRVLRSREMIAEAMAGFTLAVIILAPLAVVEFIQGWILYAGLEERWGAAHMIGYLKRGDFLRAQVTGGHSIVLGNAFAVGLGFCLYVQARLGSRAWRSLAVLTVLGGLVATLARGPWVGAVAAVLVFLALGPNAASRSIKAVALLAVAGAIAFATPLGDKLANHLPFIGTLDVGSVSYRQRLAEISWSLIWQNPLFGSPNFMQYMEELRQGEGIIDLVNGYAAVALVYGLVGFSFFAGFFAVIAVKCLRAVRRLAAVDPDSSSMGAGLLAAIAGALVVLGTTSNYLSIPYIYWSLGALAFAYSRLSLSDEAWYTYAAFEEQRSTPGRVSSQG